MCGLYGFGSVMINNLHANLYVLLSFSVLLMLSYRDCLLSSYSITEKLSSIGLTIVNRISIRSDNEKIVEAIIDRPKSLIFSYVCRAGAFCVKFKEEIAYSELKSMLNELEPSLVAKL